jgi:hypothetical protein
MEMEEKTWKTAEYFRKYRSMAVSVERLRLRPALEKLYDNRQN